MLLSSSKSILRCGIDKMYEKIKLKNGKFSTYLKKPQSFTLKLCFKTIFHPFPSTSPNNGYVHQLGNWIVVLGIWVKCLCHVVISIRAMPKILAYIQIQPRETLFGEIFINRWFFSCLIEFIGWCWLENSISILFSHKFFCFLSVRPCFV